MTVKEVASIPDIKAINLCNAENEISGVYCCDLLSFVMGKAFAGCCWVTVMGNINSIAVATLADMSCIILADSAQLDENALEKARQHNIPVFSTDKPIFETALAVHTAMNNG